MLSSTFLTPSIKLSLPIAHAGSTTTVQDIVVTLSSDETVYLNKQQVTFATLGAELRILMNESGDKAVTIRGDSELNYATFIRALDIAKQNGAEHVNIAHQSTP